jgi:hypothetical protein
MAPSSDRRFSIQLLPSHRYRLSFNVLVFLHHLKQF